ncbi:neurotrophin 1 isoform X2 [Spodoptera frugiperda]|uniref:Neurotrophin 1 isoform X2 n=1 Tax=Spodoptera frugiperda TaxID=7108 RepID=A0A9R0E1C5_SPOFR|nr:neurotrophin 1 isoform X2 [Spodoptera frugiperda]
MARLSRVFLFAALVALLKADDELKDFEFSDPDEVMIAQESRQYQTVVKPPVRIVKPTGVTNSHRPQYNLDSFEDRSQDTVEEYDNSPRRSLVKNYKSSHKIRAKEGMVKDAVLRALERKDHVGKFAQILPIIRAMSGNQRVALASLVSSQVSTPPGRAPLNLAQNSTTSTTTTEATTPLSTSKSRATITSRIDNGTLDLTAESTNQTLAQDLPVAEKLRALSRYTDRKGSSFRRGVYQPKPPSLIRRTTPEPAATPPSIPKRRQIPPRKLPTSAADPNKCELFTNSLCLHSEDYPTEAIVQSIRRNKAAAAALLADYKDPGEGVVDGVTAAQEAKYNEQHYLVSNRRGDTANRDFAGAGEAGFMCPSTVKYARPQRARATSGQWKYIVNTGEHTQTLRLEKCLKPKESCTYLTDNFKSKCVQVYNYHRLLTWDQQNGLHMDIFKVPTCCSCHIEGYSVSFPPLGHRLHETSSEHFPGEDLSSETGNHAFENVQSTIQKPKIKSPPFTHKKPLESFPPFTDTQNLIPGSPFTKHNDNEDSVPGNPIDSYGNTYFPDSFNQASSIRQIKRPLLARNPSQTNFEEVTLPSYLEPPTPAAGSSFNNFIKDTSPKFKIPGSQFKRTARPNPPSRRPIRKKIAGGPDDLMSSGSQAVEYPPNSTGDSAEENDYEEPDIGQATSVNTPKPRVTIAPKLPALTTEKITPAHKQREPSNNNNENFTSNGKRVNYNYHPIIDFFDEDKAMETEESIDREDIEPSFIPSEESEWKPINHPPSRDSQINTVGRKKHK